MVWREGIWELGVQASPARECWLVRDTALTTASRAYPVKRLRVRVRSVLRSVIQKKKIYEKNG